MYFDLFHDDLLNRKYRFYQELHAHGCVLRGPSPMPEFDECWYVIGYQEALTVLRSDQFIHDKSKVSGYSPLSNFTGPAREFWESMVEWPLFMDPPEHTNKRLALANFFKMQSVQSLEQFIEIECNALLDKALQKPEFDLMWDFSYPLMLSVTCKVIGIQPPQTAWFKDLIRVLADAMDFHASDYDYVPAIRAIEKLSVHLENDIAIAGVDTLCGQLALDGMSKKDKTSLLIQLLFAGQETSADAIGNLMLALNQRRDLWQRIKADSGLVSQVCKESLRYDTSLQFTGIRTAREDVKLGNVTINRGDSIVIATGACNHDPRHFDAPANFNCERTSSGPELTFGHGIHYCLGVHLARVELQIALKTLVNKLPISWQVHESVMRKNIVFHGPTLLRVSTA